MILEKGGMFANRYILVKQIGRGGYSIVWLARDTIANIEVVLKIYAPHAGLDEEGLRVFAEEFTLLFDLNHSNLLKPAFFEVEDKKPYLVLPYCPHGSCKRMVGDIKEGELWSLVVDIASGLEFLHALTPPIIHQDIKPDNILRGHDGKFLITDFGISTRVRSTLRKSLSASEISGAGTTSYMGPERFSRTPMPIKASDIWSLGATLFELMTGNVPFGDTGGLMQKMGAEIPYIEGEYSKEIKTVVEKCLAKNTWDRPTATELKEYAMDYLAGRKNKILEKKIYPNPKDKKKIARKIIKVVVIFIISIGFLVGGTLSVYKLFSQPPIERDNTKIISILGDLHRNMDNADRIVQIVEVNQSGVLDSLIRAKKCVEQTSLDLDSLAELQYNGDSIMKYTQKKNNISQALSLKIDKVFSDWEKAADEQVEFNPEVASDWYYLLLELKENTDVRRKLNAIRKQQSH